MSADVQPVVPRDASRSDAAAVAALHARNLPGAFLPRLGRHFLTTLYAALIEDEEGLVLVAEEDGRVVGFVATVRSVRRFYVRFALRHGVTALLAAGRRLLQPGALRGAVETALYPREIEPPDAEILAIAVGPERRGTGVAFALVEEAVGRLARAGVPSVRITINTHNAAARTTFEQLGFRRAGRVSVHRGKPNDVLVRETGLHRDAGPRRLAGPEGDGSLVMPRPLRVAHVATVGPTVRLLLVAQLRRLRDEGYEVAAISAPDPRVRELEAEGIRFLPWRGATRAFDLASDARAFVSLYAMLRRERFDIVHTHNPKPGFLGRFAARLAGVPCVVNTVHGLYATPDDGPVKKAIVLSLEWLAGRVSDLELFQSEEDLRWTRRIGLVEPPPAAYLGNGVDVSRFRPAAVPEERVRALRQELGIPPGAPVVGAIGRLVAEKGYRELFEAARAVRAVVPEARFLVVGPPDHSKPDALDERELAAVDDGVVLAGWRSDVRDVLAAMDVFVLASWREGLPRSAVEAAAMARPLVLTDIRGCREVVRDGVEGILVPPRDPKALGEAILALVRDPGLREEMGGAARRRAEEHFDERRVAQRVVDRYRELLLRKGIVAREATVERLGQIAVRRASMSDAVPLARFHLRAHPAAFLPVLGEPFLVQLYRQLIEDPESVAIVAERDGKIVGFATGVMSMSGFYKRFIRRRGVRAAVAVGPRLLHPDVLRKVFETATYPQKAQALPDAEFTSLAVAPGIRAKGLGGALTQEIVRELSARGAPAIRGTVNTGNAPMNRMMTREGFRQVGQITLHDGSLSNLYVIPCRSSSPSGSGSS